MLSSFRYFTRCSGTHFSFPGNGIPVASEQTGTAARSEAHLGHAGARSPTEVCRALASEGEALTPIVHDFQPERRTAVKIYRSGYRVAALSLGMLLTIGLLTANADDKVKTVEVDCTTGKTLAHALEKGNEDKALVVVVQGTCTENITITRDDVTLVADPGGATVNGTITIQGARRVVIKSLRVTGSGAGVVGTDNAAFTVEDSVLDRNGTDGIVVANGAQATITGNTITNNGQAALPDSGRGIYVNNSASAEITKNTIEDNRSDGIGVFNNAYANVRENLIQRNGRPDPICDAGIQLSRAHVRANGNIIKDNGCAAVEVSNSSDYRTGSFLNSVEQPDNEFPFEQIEGVGPGKRAVDVGNASYVDLRQVNVRGSVSVGLQGMLQVRGDNVGPTLQCSTIDFDFPGGSFQVSGFNGFVRLQTVKVTPPSAFVVFGPSGQILEQNVCP